MYINICGSGVQCNELCVPLDWVYYDNHSPIKQEIIDLIHSKGGKANQYDENGRWVGAGTGDLND